MTEPSHSDQLKEKFRPDTDAGLDRQVDAAVGDLNKLYGFDKPSTGPADLDAGKRLARGLHKGKVASIGSEEVFIDLGGKSQGMVPLEQFDSVKTGDEVEVIIERYDEEESLYICSKKGALLQTVNWDTIEVGQVVEATITAMNKGGLEAQVKTIRAFMPSGQVDIHFIKDISNLIGQRMTVEVTRVDREKKNLVISRRVIQEREREEARQKLMAELGEGQIRRGVVRSVTDYGAFVDLGGVDGLLHVSEMSHRRIRHPSEVVKENDLVEVKVTRIDPESGKVSLSLKQTTTDPWLEAGSRYAVGSTVTARVARIEPFGAFLEVEEGVEGLLPVSEISYQRIGHPGDVVKEGQTIGVIVINLDTTARKLTFSLKQAGPDPWILAVEKYPVHSVVSGKVLRTTEFGAFIELEPGLEGLAHISELAPHRVKSVNEVVQVGQEVKVRVLEIDKARRRVGLSIRRASEPAPAPAAAAPEASAPAAAARKKNRPLRGGLDF